MKKLSFPLAAIVLAIIFSAFTPQQNKEAAAGTESLLYWYFIDQDGKIDSEVDGQNLQTRSEVFSTVSCPGVSGDDCARGYSSTQTLGVTAPAISNPDEHIMKNN